MASNGYISSRYIVGGPPGSSKPYIVTGDSREPTTVLSGDVVMQTAVAADVVMQTQIAADVRFATDGG